MLLRKRSCLQSDDQVDRIENAAGNNVDDLDDFLDRQPPAVFVQVAESLAPYGIELTQDDDNDDDNNDDDNDDDDDDDDNVPNLSREDANAL